MPYSSQNTKIRKRITLLDASENADAALYLTDLDTPPPALTGVGGALAFGANGRIIEWVAKGSYADWNLGVGVRKEATLDNSGGTGNMTVTEAIDFSPFVLPDELTCQVAVELVSGITPPTGFAWQKTGASEITIYGTVAAAVSVIAYVTAY